MNMEMNGRLPVSVRTETDELTGTIERRDDEVVVRFDSGQFPDMWLEGRVKLEELLKAMEENNE